MTLETVLLRYVLPIVAAYFLAWLFHRLARRIIPRFVRLSGYAPATIRLREERRRTLQDLLGSMISFMAFLIASIFALSLFVDANTLVWLIGLFSAGLGFGARPLISDWLTGIGFMFEDTFDVGEKVEILEVEGVIEHINLRTTFLRAPTGELYVIPNGEIRVIRNFSRGDFSTAKVILKVYTADLEQVTDLLKDLGQIVARNEEDVLDPWQVIAVGEAGQHTDLMVIVRTRFARAADLRARLLTHIQREIAEAGFDLPQ